MTATKISWATDVWNPVTGCTRVSPGCLNCYADRLHNFRYRANVRAAVDWWNRSPQGRDAPNLRNWRPVLAMAYGFRHLDGLTLPQALRLAGIPLFTLPWPPTYDTPFATVQVHPDRLVVPIRAKKPRTYFVNSMSDLFHQDIPPDFLDAVFTKSNWRTGISSSS